MKEDVRNVGSGRIAFSVEEDIVHDVDNAVANQDIGANDAGRGTVAVAHEQSSSVVVEREWLAAGAIDGGVVRRPGGRRRVNGHFLKRGRVQRRPVHILVDVMSRSSETSIGVNAHDSAAKKGARSGYSADPPALSSPQT